MRMFQEWDFGMWLSGVLGGTGLGWAGLGWARGGIGKCGGGDQTFQLCLRGASEKKSLKNDDHFGTCISVTSFIGTCLCVSNNWRISDPY